MDELVTIIIPVYNAGNNIRRCVKSILNSSYLNYEIIIIDDGSDKVTYNECDKLTLLDKRIKVFHQANGGVSSARNAGIEKAEGSLITFVDADDYIDPDMLISMVDTMKKENADIVITGHREIYNDGTYKECFCNKKTVVNRDNEILVEFFTTSNIGWTVWAKLYRKSVIKDVRFRVGIKIAEDMFFNYEALKNAKIIAKLGFAKYSYIKNEESAMASSNYMKLFDSFYLTKEVFEDEETNRKYKYEKEYFYIKNELYIFRMIYAKAKHINSSKELKIIREIFINSLKGDEKNISLRMNVELFVFKYLESIYKIVANMYWMGRAM